MKRKMVLNHSEILDIISESKTCYIAMVDKDGLPYNLPFNFGFDNNFLYFHSAFTGKKIDILKSNPNVCIAFSNNEKLKYQNANVACSHFLQYKSAIVIGEVEFIEDNEEKAKALNIFMKHYTGKADYNYSKPSLQNVIVFKVSTNKMSGKTFDF